MEPMVEKFGEPKITYKAAGRGQCGRCRRIIEKGEDFHWVGSRPAVPVCHRCQAKKRAA